MKKNGKARYILISAIISFIVLGISYILLSETILIGENTPLQGVDIALIDVNITSEIAQPCGPVAVIKAQKQRAIAISAISNNSIRTILLDPKHGNRGRDP